MPVFSLTYISKVVLKGTLFLFIISFLPRFTGYLLQMIPPLNLNGCMGYFVSQLGLVLALKLYISIVVYAYVFKFTLNLFSKSLD